MFSYSGYRVLRLNGGALKMQDVKMREMTDQVAGHEIDTETK